MLILLFIACFHYPYENELNSACMAGLKEELIDNSSCEIYTVPSPQYPGTNLIPISCKNETTWTKQEYLITVREVMYLVEEDPICIDGALIVWRIK